MTVSVTINSLKADYQAYLQAQNSAINPTAPYFAIQAGAMAAFFIDLYYNLQLVENSIYPQNAVSDQVDLWLYRQGLPSRGGMTFGTINVYVSSSTPIVIPANTIFTDSVTGNQYQSLVSLDVPNDTTAVTLYALIAGQNILEPTNSSLSSTSITVVVNSSTNGQLEESDQSCINRILQSLQAPLAGARSTDYTVYALRSNPEVTYAVIIPEFVFINSVNILGVFPLVGTNITEYQLNQGLLPTTSFISYSREAGTGILADVSTYIQSLRLVGLTVVVGACITQEVVTSISTLTVTVSLVSGYSLSTILTIDSDDINGNPTTVQLTIEQLIQRETRRAICNQPFGATNINGQNCITINSLLYSIDTQLSSTNGLLAQILTNTSISGGDISVPNASYDPSSIYYTYDIHAYTDIIVGVA